MGITTLTEYEAAALRTANEKILPFEESMGIYAMGLSGEAGEVVDILKKVVGHKHDLDKAKLTKEIGDVFWYMAVMGNRLGFPITSDPYINSDNLDSLYDQFKGLVVDMIDMPAGPRKTILLCLRLSQSVGRISDYVEAYITCNTVGGGPPLHTVLLYLTLIAHDQGVLLSEVAEVNYQKLLQRYPNGFNPKDSINRTVET